MTVYNINLGIGWASSGVEYAQAYRSTIFKNTGIKAKFVFMDMFLQDNLSDLTRNMGFEDEDVIWLFYRPENCSNDLYCQGFGKGNPL